MLDLRVETREALLVRFEMVIGAVVGLDVAMLGAEDVGALACHLDDSNFLLAMPALVLVSLSENRESELQVTLFG